MSREYLADEITMIQSDNLVLKQENALYKMTNERKAEENRLLKDELDSCKIALAEKIDEAAALRTILEGVGHNVKAGLERFLERRQLKQARQDTNRAAQAAPLVVQVQAREAVLENQREEQGSGHEAYAPPSTRGTERTRPIEYDASIPPAPSFLRQGQPPRPEVRHPLLHEQMLETLEPKIMPRSQS